MANNQTPDSYAQDYLSTLVSRWNGTLGTAVKAYAPVVFPGAPPEALVGFTTIGGQYEDTGLPPVNNSFHEIGYFQTEAGPGSGPSPNPSVSSGNNNWARLANDPRVVALLGRGAVMDNNAWGSAVYDQAAVGLYNLSDAAANVANGLAGGIGPESQGSLWNLVLGFTGFSAGVSGARSSINRYANALVGVPEAGRFAAWIDAVLTDAMNGTLPGPTGGHGNPAYDILRTWQKLAAGKMLAQQTGGNVAWFDVGFGPNDAAAQAGILNAAYRQPVTGVPSYTVPSGGFDIGGVLIAAAIFGTGAYFAYKMFEENQPQPYARRR